ncbi:MAG: dihydroneopterin aldolase family protein [Methanosarcinales archaeon]|nr:dihydroneopterin aldolase family protein [Methanosarcinales archaeon]
MMVITDRDNALFEAGIKLGALYHQFVGSPVNPGSVDSLESAISQSISVQPYVRHITVRIDRDMVHEKAGGEFGYCELEGRMLDVETTIQFNDTTARVGLKFDRERDYPLMQIIEVREK